MPLVIPKWSQDAPRPEFNGLKMVSNGCDSICGWFFNMIVNNCLIPIPLAHSICSAFKFDVNSDEVACYYIWEEHGC